MSRDILVVKRDTLFKEKQFNGFCPISEYDFSKLIQENLEYQHRDDALETNPEFQQIIPYVWLVNKKTKQAFLYKRSKGGDEDRLHNKYSGGVGGHIDRDTDESAQDPLTAAMMRELEEEVTMQNYPVPKFVGFLNDDNDPVGKVHFGVVAIAETQEQVSPAMHMSSGQFYPVEEIEKIFNNKENTIESWTQLSWPFVKDYLEKN
ncbi:MAG: NUDIX domain-containing protein [Nanoarchaeota archaeon]|nr:NUDIX domain-containing protein [Nanoarchaeota archaeon]